MNAHENKHSKKNAPQSTPAQLVHAKNDAAEHSGISSNTTHALPVNTTAGSGGLTLRDNRAKTDLPVQRKANTTGLPDNLKSGIENLSGQSMDDVKVNYNSSQPAQLNAHAYAQGNQIHVAPGQEKHVPHEAWHVVQQKQGRVKPTIQMKGKVNINDDRSLEKEADVMGAKALQRAEVPAGNLRTFTPQQKTIQGYFLMHNVRGVFMMAQEKRRTRTGSSFLNESGKSNLSLKMSGTMRVSDDGQIAIENGGGSRQAKTFYASEKVLASANAKLKSVGSPMRLAFHPGMAISIRINDKVQRLSLTYPIDLQAKKVGHEVGIPQRCNEAGPYVGNTTNSNWLRPKYKTGHSHDLPGGQLSFLTDSRLAALLPLLLKAPGEKNKGVVRLFFESMQPWWQNVLGEMHTVQKGTFTDYRNYLHMLGGGSGEFDDPHMSKGLDRIGERYIKEFINKVGSKKIMKEIGINEYIDPKVGDVLSIRSIGSEQPDGPGKWKVMDHQSGKMLKNPFQYHFATVIAKAGHDYITMENYARQEEEGHTESGTSQNDPRYYFQMFGPMEQSFHSENKSDYANAMTLNFSPDRQGQDFGHDLESESVKGQVGNYNRQLDRLRG